MNMSRLCLVHLIICGNNSEDSDASLVPAQLLLTSINCLSKHENIWHCTSMRTYDIVQAWEHMTYWKDHYWYLWIMSIDHPIIDWKDFSLWHILCNGLWVSTTCVLAMTWRQCSGNTRLEDCKLRGSISLSAVSPVSLCEDVWSKSQHMGGNVSIRS